MEDLNQEKKADTPTLKIGEHLTQLRESRGASVKSLSQQTKISSSTITALEQNNFKHLPNKAYTKGFVKSLVKTLDGDQELALKIFEDTYRQEFPEEYAKTDEDLVHGPIKKMRTREGQNASILIYGGVLVFAIIGVLYFFGSRDQSQVEIATPETVTPTPPTESSEVEARETEAPTQRVSEAPETQQEIQQEIQEEIQETARSAPESEALEEVVEVGQVEAASTSVSLEDLEVNIRPFPPTELFTIANEEHTQLVEEHIPAEFRNLNPEAQNVFITAIDGSSWLTYKIDDGQIRRVILNPGRHIKLQGEVIRLFVGNLNSLKIFLDNQLIDAPSRTGVKSLVFPEHKKAEFQLPLFIFPGDGSTLTSEEYQEMISTN